MPSFFYYVLNLSTMLLHSTTLRVHQPFDTVMENSGVKTRSSEQAMVPVEAYISMVTGSSSEEDSKTDDQSYSPSPEVYALINLAGSCCSYRAYGVLHCYVI